MEIIDKLYLELATVKSPQCKSVHELALEKERDGHGLALMMIANGCADPQKVATDRLAAVAASR